MIYDKDSASLSNQFIIRSNPKFSSQSQKRLYRLKISFNIPVLPIEGNDLVSSKEKDQLIRVIATGFFIFYFGQRQYGFKVVW